jgi:3-hydroxyisobutyrate dehydrogenase
MAARAATPAEAADGRRFVMACVGNDDDLRSVCDRRGRRVCGMAEGAVFVDHTTVSAKVTRELDAAAREAGFLRRRAGLGRAGGRRERRAVVMCGGEEAPMGAPSRSSTPMPSSHRLGDSGAGQLTKMVNQICIAGLVQGLSEGCISPRRPGSTGARWSR